jgi:hypothetical protein
MHRNKCYGSFKDMKDLIGGNVGEALRRFRDGPGYLDALDFRGGPDSDVLTKGIASEAGSKAYRAVDAAFGLAILHDYTNAGADGGPVRLDSFEFQGDPMVSGMPRILEERAGVSVSG